MTEILRGYQVDVIADVEREVAAGNRRIILVAPTGSGKTIIAGAIIAHFTESYRPVLVLAHRLEIITQTSVKLYGRNIRHGIIKAGFEPRPMERVQLASVQTLWVRAMRSQAMPLPPADLVIIDECHHATAQTWRKIIAAYPDAVIIGLTATPCRGDGRGLGGIFTTMIECPQVAELIVQGYLVRTRVYAPINPDLTGVRTVAGDYVESQLADRMDVAKLVGDIVTHWHKFGERRRTIAFGVNVAHSLHLRDEFVKSGVRCEHLDGETPKDERDAILARLASGETEVVTNCMVLTEGFDCPDIGCIILARPTKKMGLYRQMIGRGLRPAEGKADCIILDHSGAVYRHGPAEDRVEWTLDPEQKAEAPTHQARLNHRAPRMLECSQCTALRFAGEKCPHCGFLPKRPPRDVPTAPGELGLYANGHALSNVYDPAVRRTWHAMLIHIQNERGYSSKWAKANYHEKFKRWPDSWEPPAPIPPSAEVRSWVRSRQIAYARSRTEP